MKTTKWTAKAAAVDAAIKDATRYRHPYAVIESGGRFRAVPCPASYNHNERLIGTASLDGAWTSDKA